MRMWDIWIQIGRSTIQDHISNYALSNCEFKDPRSKHDDPNRCFRQIHIKTRKIKAQIRDQPIYMCMPGCAVYFHIPQLFIVGDTAAFSKLPRAKSWQFCRQEPLPIASDGVWGPGAYPSVFQTCLSMWTLHRNWSWGKIRLEFIEWFAKRKINQFIWMM